VATHNHLSGRITGQKIDIIKPVLMLILLCCISVDARATAFSGPTIPWYTIESEHFITHYHKGIEHLAPRAVAIAEAAHAELSERLTWMPGSQTHMVLIDRIDMSNGAATPLPRNTMYIFVSPPDDIDSLEDHGGWLETVIFHEYTHILHLDMAKGVPRFLRVLVGRNPLLYYFVFPQWATPHWMKEGLATYVETDDTRGIGRGQSSYFEMMMRTEVINGIQPIRKANQIYSTWPGGTVPYLYGVYFHRFLAETYGEDKMRQWLHEHSDNFLPFFVNYTALQVFDKNLHELWKAFEVYLHKKFDSDIERLESQQRSGERLTHRAYRTSNPRIAASGELYFVSSDGVNRNTIYKREPSGKESIVVEVNHSARFDYHAESGIAVVMPETNQNVEMFYDLYLLAPQSKSLKRLTSQGRFHFVAWHPNGEQLLLAQSEADRNRLMLADKSGNIVKTLWESPANVVVSSPTWTPDGKHIIASVWEPESGWNLQQYSLDTGKWQLLTRGPEIENHPFVSEDGRYVFFTMENEGVYDIHRLDRESGEIRRITQVISGAFNPQVRNDQLFYTGYHIDGFDLYQMKISPESAVVTRPSTAVLSSGTGRTFRDIPGLQERSYSGLRYMTPTAWGWAIGYGGDAGFIGGISLLGSDPLDHHNYFTRVFYNGNPEQISFYLGYINNRWTPQINLDGGREIGIANDTTKDLYDDRFAGMSLLLPWSKIRQGAYFTLRGEVQENHILSSSTQEMLTKDRLYLGGLGVGYKNHFRPRLSISPEDGREIEFALETHRYESGEQGNLARGIWSEYINLKRNRVLALRGIGVAGFDQADRSLLGGKSLQAQSIQSGWGGRSFPMRAYPEAQINARKILFAGAELRVPLGRLERGLMAPPIGINYLSMAFYAEAGWGKDHISGVRDILSMTDWYRGVGAEMRINTISFYYMPLNIHIGLAKAMDGDKRSRGYLTLTSDF